MESVDARLSDLLTEFRVSRVLNHAVKSVTAITLVCAASFMLKSGRKWGASGASLSDFCFLLSAPVAQILFMLFCTVTCGDFPLRDYLFSLEALMTGSTFGHITKLEFPSGSR